MRTQPAAGEIEGSARAGAGFEEQVGDGHAGQFATLVGALAREAPVIFGAIEDGGERFARQPVEGDEVAQTAVIV